MKRLYATVMACFCLISSLASSQDKSDPTYMLAKAVFEGDLPLARAAIAAGANARFKDPQSNDSIINLTYDLGLGRQDGRQAILELLLANGADINTRSGDGSTALFHTASMANVEAVKTLIGRGADPNIANNQFRTPVHEAVLNAVLTYNEQNVEHYLDITRILVGNGANIDAVNSRDGSPLSVALSYSFTAAGKRFAEELIRLGANVNGQLRDRRTLLQWAIDQKAVTACRILLEKGVNLGTLDQPRRAQLLTLLSSTAQ